MKVKVGSKWFEVEKGSPICVVLTEFDKENIRGMAASAARYAVFDDAEELTSEEMKVWMMDDFPATDAEAPSRR
jgi:hypothetical protein